MRVDRKMPGSLDDATVAFALTLREFVADGGEA
jgi:hypothetical protein